MGRWVRYERRKREGGGTLGETKEWTKGEFLMTGCVVT